MNIEQVQKALIEWETTSANKENRALYEPRAKDLRDLLSNLEGERRLGREEGLREGREEWQFEIKREMAIELLKEGISIEIIEKATRLNRTEIESLKKSL